MKRYLYRVFYIVLIHSYSMVCPLTQV